MSYRPEGWVVKRNHPPPNEDIAEYISGYEAGADAMLEGLKEEGLYEVGSRELSVLHGLIEVDRAGTIVFIPSEESKDGKG